MALIVEDRVAETSTTTGTGSFALDGAVTSFKTFASVCTVNDTVYYMIEAIDAAGVPSGAWESGLGTYSAANTLARTTVSRSSNANAAVSFSAGTKRCYISLTRAFFRPATPAIVQSSYTRVQSVSNANLTALAAAPTVGNLLILMWMGPGGLTRSTPPSTFKLVYGVFKDTTLYSAGIIIQGDANQGFWVATRRVQAGDTATFASGSSATGTDNYALIEIADADLIEADFVALQLTSSTAFIAHKRRKSYSALRFLFVEHDGTPTVTINTVSGVTVLNAFNPTAGTNHSASIAQIADDYDADVAGSFSAAPTNPVAVWLTVAKR